MIGVSFRPPTVREVTDQLFIILFLHFFDFTIFQNNVTPFKPRLSFLLILKNLGNKLRTLLAYEIKVFLICVQKKQKMVAVSKNVRTLQKSKVYTFDEYLRREEKALEKHEFYNGQIIKVMGGTDVHSEISMNIGTAIKIATKSLLRVFRVYNSDLKIRIEASDIGVYPDALVICEQPEFWNNRRDIVTNPLLIVEVLSPSTQSYDRLGKFELYKQIPSFQEYVLVSTDGCSVETRFQEEPDLWRIKKYTNSNDTIALRSLGTTISMVEVYEHIEFGGDLA